MYTYTNYKTKKALKDALAAGKIIEVYQPNDITGGDAPIDGKVTLEGPHYPAPHRWYAMAVIKDGRVISVK